MRHEPFTLTSPGEKLQVSCHNLAIIPTSCVVTVQACGGTVTTSEVGLWEDCVSAFIPAAMWLFFSFLEVVSPRLVFSFSFFRFFCFCFGLVLFFPEEMFSSIGSHGFRVFLGRGEPRAILNRHQDLPFSESVPSQVKWLDEKGTDGYFAPTRF